MTYKTGVAKGRGNPRQHPSAKFITQGSQGQLLGRSRTRFAARLERKPAGLRSPGRRATHNRSDLCYRLRTPTPHEVSTDNKSKRLYFCQDSTVHTNGSGFVNAVPQRVKTASEVKVGSKREEKHGRVVGNVGPQTQREGNPVLHGPSLEGRLSQSQDHWRSCPAGIHIHTDAVSHVGASRVPPPPPEALLSPILPVAARSSRSRSRQEVEKDEDSPCAVRHYNSNGAMNLRGGQSHRRRQQLQTTERKTPPRDHQRQQQEQQQIESASRLSEIHVSPLTECSPVSAVASGGGGGGERSPIATLLYRATPYSAGSSDCVEREPSLREVMTEHQRRTSLNRGASLPSQQERSILHAGFSGNALAVTSPQSAFFSKSHRLFGDDRTNTSCSSSGAASLHTTRRAGAGGIMLHQLFGHEQRPIFSSPANIMSDGDEARSSTDVLLSRIKEMRAQMK
ncbi:hypothetical protein TraAM80_07325 [Trypanosoma rangeli]|uniref:Uncharacterized protein n=1 Tax=Trypanosoma rangeli TaxID=5698 RepID=A0A422N636_TRYRA|nr:uncharacterized protein TraAM80_07325 [Trypanosoma rangeli]RNF00906.1 hypothetical protein TraAM80_07325 [Trypanosoma rangeli]|eukprot:RNF00906.1 hypothetical protein TraAM80_07325 [Trypanosoma rangeli]